MNIILNLIINNINNAIVISGIVVAALLCINCTTLASDKSRIGEAVTRRNKKYGVDQSDDSFVTEDDEDAAITPDTIRKYESKFNKSCALHSVLSQLISVFPLMGILGTVAGLMSQVNAGDLENMLSSLDVALSSTFFALIFAIILKTADAVFPSRIIEDVEVMLDDFDKKLYIADMVQRIKK